MAESGEDTDESVHRRRKTRAARKTKVSAKLGDQLRGPEADVKVTTKLGDQLRGPEVNVRESGTNGMIGGSNLADEPGMIMVAGPGGPGILAGKTVITLTCKLPLFRQVLLEQHLLQLLMLLCREDQIANRSQAVRESRCTMMRKIMRNNIILYRNS